MCFGKCDTVGCPYHAECQLGELTLCDLCYCDMVDMGEVDPFGGYEDDLYYAPSDEGDGYGHDFEHDSQPEWME